MNINKFTQNSMQAVQNCEKIAYDYGNQELAQEHLLYALVTQDDSLILKGAAGSEANTKTQVFIPQNSDLNLELCALAQAVTVGKTDVDKAIADFKKAAEMILD